VGSEVVVVVTILLGCAGRDAVVQQCPESVVFLSGHCRPRVDDKPGELLSLMRTSNPGLVGMNREALVVGDLGNQPQQSVDVDVCITGKRQIVGVSAVASTDGPGQA
jgi:hypothetical protein